MGEGTECCYFALISRHALPLGHPHYWHEIIESNMNMLMCTVHNRIEAKTYFCNIRNKLIKLYWFFLLLHCWYEISATFVVKELTLLAIKTRLLSPVMFVSSFLSDLFSSPKAKILTPFLLKSRDACLNLNAFSPGALIFLVLRPSVTTRQTCIWKYKTLLHVLNYVH